MFVGVAKAESKIVAGGGGYRGIHGGGGGGEKKRVSDSVRDGGLTPL